MKHMGNGFEKHFTVAAVLIVCRNMLEQVRHGLLIVNASNGLRQHHAHVDGSDLAALHLLRFVWYGVRYDNLR